jgi:hypothetical protein
MSVSFSAKAGSVESLKCRQRCGLRPWAFQIACTVDAATSAIADAGVGVTPAPGGRHSGIAVAQDMEAELRAVAGGQHEFKTQPLNLLERPDALFGHLAEMAELLGEHEIGYGQS